MAFKVETESIYLTDNGAALCGEHLGRTAKATGRDISGQPIHRITPDDLEILGTEVCCEECGRVASRLVRP